MFATLDSNSLPCSFARRPSSVAAGGCRRDPESDPRRAGQSRRPWTGGRAPAPQQLVPVGRASPDKRRRSYDDRRANSHGKVSKGRQMAGPEIHLADPLTSSRWPRQRRADPRAKVLGDRVDGFIFWEDERFHVSVVGDEVLRYQDLPKLRQRRAGLVDHQRVKASDYRLVASTILFVARRFQRRELRSLCSST